MPTQLQLTYYDVLALRHELLLLMLDRLQMKDDVKALCELQLH